jgi:hypothetical protein
MDLAMMAVAERLAEEFPDRPNSSVIRVLTDCVDQHPEADAAFVEQAARARLAAQQLDEGEQVRNAPRARSPGRSSHRLPAGHSDVSSQQGND